MIDLRDKQTYFTAATDTLWERDKHIFRCKETRTHILLQKDTLCFFTARRQTTLFYYTDTNTYILWQRLKETDKTILLHRHKHIHFVAKTERDRQNYFTTQTQTHTFCGKETDKTILLHRQTHTFCSKETKQFHYTDANTCLLQQRDRHTFLG